MRAPISSQAINVRQPTTGASRKQGRAQALVGAWHEWRSSASVHTRSSSVPGRAGGARTLPATATRSRNVYEIFVGYRFDADARNEHAKCAALVTRTQRDGQTSWLRVPDVCRASNSKESGQCTVQNGTVACSREKELDEMPSSDNGFGVF